MIEISKFIPEIIDRFDFDIMEGWTTLNRAFVKQKDVRCCVKLRQTAEAGRV